jgi:hypothetical protein
MNGSLRVEIESVAPELNLPTKISLPITLFHASDIFYTQDHYPEKLINFYLQPKARRQGSKLRRSISIKYITHSARNI